MKGLETTMERVGKILSKNYGVTVTCKGNSCHTDGRTITLPAVPDELPIELERALHGYLDHEVGHILHSEFDVIKPFKETHGDKGFDVLNIIEDARINRVMGTQYIGAGMNIKASNEFVHRKLMDAETEQMSPWRKFSTCLCTRVLGLDSSAFGPEINSVVDMLSEELAEIPNLKSTQDSMALSVKIMAKLFGPQQKNKTQGQEGKPDTGQQPKGGSMPQDGAGDNDNNGEASPMPPAAPEAGGNEDVAPASEDSPGDKEEPAQQDAPDTVPETRTEKHPTRQAQFIEDCRLDEAGGGDTLATLIEQEIDKLADTNKAWRVYDPTNDKVIKPKAMDDSAYRDLLESVKPYISGLRQKMMLALKAKKACRWIGEQESGAINPPRLSGLITGTSSKVFKVKHVEEAKSTAVSLLIDMSGSMSGSKMTLARMLAIAFSECMNGLGLPHEVIGFTTSTRPEHYVEQAQNEMGMTTLELMDKFTRLVPLRITVFKDFSDSFRVARGRFPIMKAKGLTPLHESLMIAAKRLVTRSENRKVVLCLTDGYPELWPDTGSLMVDEAIKTVGKINKAGIEVIGIGIQTDAVEQIFPQHVVINELEDLPKGFFRQLSKALAA